MASRKDMPAIAFIDMHGEVDLRTLPVGTRIVTTGITKFRHYVKENHTRYVKEKNCTWYGSGACRRSDHSLAEDLNEQTHMGRRAIVHYAPSTEARTEKRPKGT